MAARKPARRSARRRPAPRPKAKALRRAKTAARSRAKVTSKSLRPRRAAARTAPRRVARSARKAAPVKAKPAAAKVKSTGAKSKAHHGKSLSLKKKATPRRVKSRPAPAPVAVAVKSRPARPLPAPKPVPHHPAHPPTLSRERRRLSDLDLLDEPKIQSEVDFRAEAAAHSGGVELQHAIERHTEAGPSLTAGDLDARWDDAYAVGDEAPGGDNPTPDQDRVDDIGKALGVVYREGEELQGSDKIAERDAHRWELDPASSDDWPHKP